MEKKTAIQMIHDLKSPIDAVTELVSVVYEMSSSTSIENFKELNAVLEKLVNMSATLSVYMNERYEENKSESAEMEAHKQLNLQAHAQLVILENDPLLIQSYRFMAQRKNKIITIYSKSEDLLANLDKYTFDVPISLDYELDNGENGIEIAKLLNQKGFKNLYLASGYDFSASAVPSYLRILPDKKDVMGLV